MTFFTVLYINDLNNCNLTSYQSLISLSNTCLHDNFPCPYLLHFTHIYVPQTHLATFPDFDFMLITLPQRGLGHQRKSGLFIICLSLKNILYFLKVRTSTKGEMFGPWRIREQCGHLICITLAFEIFIIIYLPLPLRKH